MKLHNVLAISLLALSMNASANDLEKAINDKNVTYVTPDFVNFSTMSQTDATVICEQARILGVEHKININLDGVTTSCK